MAIDTLKIAKRLQEAGFSPSQAEALVDAVQDAGDETGLATRRDLDEQTALLRAEMRELEQRVIARIETAGATTINRVVGLILGSVLVNVVTIFGAMFAAVKPLTR